MKHFQPMFPVKCLKSTPRMCSTYLVGRMASLAPPSAPLRLPRLRATRRHGGRGASVFSFLRAIPFPFPSLLRPPAALLWYERVLRARERSSCHCQCAPPPPQAPPSDATESTNVSKVKFVLLLRPSDVARRRVEWGHCHARSFMTFGTVAMKFDWVA